MKRLQTCARVLSAHGRGLVWSTVLLSVGTASALAAGAWEVGWQPVLTLWGGDRDEVVRTLRQVTRAFGIALHHTEIDRVTQQFMDDTLEDLHDFNLHDFYERLPRHNGAYRELWVRGDLRGGKYLVRQSGDAAADRVSLVGPRRELAASSVTLRTKQVHNRERKELYFLGYRFGLGLGPLRWERMASAASEWVRFLATGDALAARAPKVEATRSASDQVRATHPGLGEEDVAVLSVLYDAFPAFCTTFARLGRVEDVRTVWRERDYQLVHVALRALPDRFAKHYPDLARHLHKLGHIARMDMRWLDRQGRTLARIQADSEALTVSVLLYVKDGKLLPSRGATVFEAEPIDPFGPELAHTRFVSDFDFKMLGVEVKLGQLALDATYTPHAGFGELALQFTRVPKQIHVEGAALGFVPTGFLDLFIPGDMESLTRDFLRVAAEGNSGRGVVASVKLGSTDEAPQQGVLDAAVELDALDNFLVKMGVGMVNDRVLPDDASIRDSKRFTADLHDAFVRDLERYAAQHQSGLSSPHVTP